MWSTLKIYKFFLHLVKMYASWEGTLWLGFLMVKVPQKIRNLLIIMEGMPSSPFSNKITTIPNSTISLHCRVRTSNGVILGIWVPWLVLRPPQWDQVHFLSLTNSMHKLLVPCTNYSSSSFFSFYKSHKYKVPFFFLFFN